MTTRQCDHVGCFSLATKRVTERIPKLNIMYFCTKHEKEYKKDLENLNRQAKVINNQNSRKKTKSKSKQLTTEEVLKNLVRALEIEREHYEFAVSEKIQYEKGYKSDDAAKSADAGYILCMNDIVEMINNYISETKKKAK